MNSSIRRHKIPSLLFTSLIFLIILSLHDSSIIFTNAEGRINQQPSVKIWRHLTQNGLHGKLRTTLQFSPLQENDVSGSTDTATNILPKHIILHEYFPSDVFLDQFELSERERIQGRYQVRYYDEESVDVERPRYRMTAEEGFFVDFLLKVDQVRVSGDSTLKHHDDSTADDDENAHNHGNRMDRNNTISFEIPIHFRYQKPGYNQTYVDVTLPETPYLITLLHEDAFSSVKWPKQFLANDLVVEQHSESASPKQMVRALQQEYPSSQFADSIELLDSKFLQSASSQEKLIAQIPVGQLEHSRVVSPITLAVSTLAAVILSICVLVYASRAP